MWEDMCERTLGHRCERTLGNRSERIWGNRSHRTWAWVNGNGVNRSERTFGNKSGRTLGTCINERFKKNTTCINERFNKNTKNTKRPKLHSKNHWISERVRMENRAEKPIQNSLKILPGRCLGNALGLPGASQG